jgi:uncharacterized protein
MYAATGAFAGLMAGLLGIGGGMIIVPALAFIFKYNSAMPPDLIMHVAAGSSLCVMLFSAQASVRAHYHYGNILWRIYRRLVLGIIIGTCLGALIADSLPTSVIRLIFGLFLLIVVIKMGIDFKPRKRKKTPPLWVDFIVALIAGLKSGLLGIGGGAIVIPYLNYHRVNLRRIAGISSLCTLTVAVSGTLAFIITGFNEAGLPPFSTGYVYWPAVIFVAIPSAIFVTIGAKLTYKLQIKQLKRGFIVILLITALHLIFD